MFLCRAIKHIYGYLFPLFSFRILFVETLIFFFMLIPNNVHPADITLAWDESTDENVIGYRVFYREEGQSYNYTQPAWEGTETTCTINGLDEATTYYFIARGFDASEQESENSNEVSTSLFYLSDFGDELAVDFKTAGIYIYNSETWKGIYHGGIDPVEMVKLDNKLAVNFGPASGIYLYNAGNWTKIYNGLSAEQMAELSGKLIIDFGLLFGIYEYTPQTSQWKRIYSKFGIPRDSMIGFGDKLVLDFKTAGIYIYENGIWNNIYNGGIDPVCIVNFNGKLAVDFGPAYGLYIYEYDTDNWKRIYTGVAIEKITGFNDKLAIDFGTFYGLYVYEYDTDTWKRIYKGVAIEKMTGLTNKLAIDFGTAYGIYQYSFETDTWTKIYNANILRDGIYSCDVFE